MVLSVCLLCFAKSKQDKIPLEMGPNPFHPAAPEPQNFTALLNPFFSREKMLHRKKMSFFFAFARQRRAREGPFAGNTRQMRSEEKKPGSQPPARLRFPKSQAPLTRRAISTAAPVSPSFHPPPAALGEPAQGPSPPTSRQGYRAFINTFAKWDIFISSFFSYSVQ